MITSLHESLFIHMLLNAAVKLLF